MARVYAIHTGSYSDQSWGPVFSTLKKAQQHVEEHYPVGNREEVEIEAHILDDEDDGQVYPLWRVIFDRANNVLYAKADPNVNVPYEPALNKPEVTLVPTPCHWYMLDGLPDKAAAHLLVDLYAPDQAHAIKVAVQARTRFLTARASNRPQTRRWEA